MIEEKQQKYQSIELNTALGQSARQKEYEIWPNMFKK
jgi:hypothetical protein